VTYFEYTHILNTFLYLRIKTIEQNVVDALMDEKEKKESAKRDRFCVQEIHLRGDRVSW